VEVFITRFDTYEQAEQAVLDAFFFAKVVSFARHQLEGTDEIVATNHRVGVSFSDVTPFISREGTKLSEREEAELLREQTNLQARLSVLRENLLSMMRQRL
jgi:hypothetical protein